MGFRMFLKGDMGVAFTLVIYQDSSASCHLLCSKSRVAPLRQVSLTRIELCACLLLSRLLFKVAPALHSFINSVHLYSDSMVSLYWIHAQSSRWKTYVANRAVSYTHLDVYKRQIQFNK